MSPSFAQRARAVFRNRSVLTLLRFGSEVVGKLPHRGDSLPEILAKALAIADTAQKIFGARARRYDNLLNRDLRERTSPTFVHLFFATSIRAHFTLDRMPVDEYLDLIEATDEDGQRLVFQERRYGSKPEVDADFFHSPGFDFHGAVRGLWQDCPRGLRLAVQTAPNGYSRETTITACPPIASETLSTTARARLAKVTAQHRHCEAAGLHRSYLLVGPRGTGKTSFCVHFARAFGGRLLELDATSLPLVSPQELGFLFETLLPDFLVINDLDRAPLGEVGPRVLFLLEMIKANHPGTTVLITVNDPTKLDSAMLRSGRIDVPIDFTVPDEAERVEIIGQHIAWPAARVEPLVRDSAGWTHAYLADLCATLAALPSSEATLNETLAATKRLWALAESAEKAGSAPPGAPETKPGPSTPPA